MRLEDFRIERIDGMENKSCSVIWECADRAPLTLFFRSPIETNNIDVSAFLLACYLPAVQSSESRVYVDGCVSPFLIDNLYTAASWISAWRAKSVPLVNILASEYGDNLKVDPNTNSAALFLSGGIDSLSTFVRLCRFYPDKSAFHFDRAVTTFGTTIADLRTPEKARKTFDETIKRLEPMTRKHGVSLHPVFTNILELNSNIPFWMHEYHGSAFASIAHAISSTKTTFFLASTFDIDHMQPWGSHPLLDRLYSSERVTIIHDGERLSRLAKLREILSYMPDLAFLRSCNRATHGSLNCGLCEKCVRTKLELLVLGRLEKHLFEIDDVTARLAKSAVQINNSYTASCYRDLLVPLNEIGEFKIETILRHKLAMWHLRGTLNSFVKGIAKVDSKYLNGLVRRILIKKGL